MTDVDPLNQGERRLLEELRQLYLDRGEPPLRRVADATGFSTSTVHAALREQERVPGWQVISGLVKELHGDIQRFEQLYELGRAERLKLPDRVNQIASALRLVPEDDDKQGVSAFASPYDWLLRDTLPPNMWKPYRTAWKSFQAGDFVSTAVLSRWLLEAAFQDKGVSYPDSSGSISLVEGVHTLAGKKVIDVRTAKWGEWAVRELSRQIHGSTSGDDALTEDVFRFLCIFLCQVYIVDAQGRDFQRRHRL